MTQPIHQSNAEARGRRAVIMSSTFRRDGMVTEGLDALSKLTANDFKGTPIEGEYKKLSPTPDALPNLVQRVLATASKGTTSEPTS